MLPEGEIIRQILDGVHDGIYVVDSAGKITYWSKGAERLTGFKSSEAVGRECSELLMHMDREGRSLRDEICPVAGTMAEGQPRELMLYVLHREGYRLPAATRVVPVRDAGGGIGGAAVIFGDVTSRYIHIKKAEEASKLLRRDPAAELENKREMEMSLHVKFDEMQRYGWPFGVLFISVDDIEKINDLYGLDKREKALRMVAMTLLSGIRSSDVVGRWSDREFIATVGDVNEHQLNFVAGRVRMLVENSVIRDAGGDIRTTVSVGATLARPKDTVYALLKRAEDLMRQSSKSGKNRVTIDAEV